MQTGLSGASRWSAVESILGGGIFKRNYGEFSTGVDSSTPGQKVRRNARQWSKLPKKTLKKAATRPKIGKTVSTKAANHPKLGRGNATKKTRLKQSVGKHGKKRARRAARVRVGRARRYRH